MSMSRLWLVGAAACALALPTARLAAQPAAATNPPAAVTSADGDTASPHYGVWGYDETGRNSAVRPGADFFDYANGGWYQHETIPADRPSFGMFDRLYELSQNRTRVLIETAAKGGSSDPDAPKVGDAYKAFMDQARVDQLDAQPLAPELATIRAERTHEDVAATMGNAPLGFEDSIIGMGIGADAKDPNAYAVYMDVAGLGLPDRDYYLKPAFAEKKAAYQAYVAQMLKAIGWADPDPAAKAIVDYETAIADISWPREDKRDPNKTYNPMPVATLATYAPGFDFKAFLANAELGSRQVVVLESNTAFPKTAALFAATPVETLQAWQAFHLTDASAPYLSNRFVQARFAFRNHTLAGQPEIQPRWKRGTTFVNGILGEAVGRLYVQSYFTPAAKAKMEALVGNLRAALRARIERVDWMTPETKAKAVQKLAMLTTKIGYPVKWRDYTALQIGADDLYGDARRGQAFEWEREVKRISEPVDKQEWGMTPQTVNAYYYTANNEVVFPAAILQPPFFDPDADPAVNYGGIGAVIGHEMTHGFDDQGRKYDGNGRLETWWAPSDGDQFETRAKRLGDQYDAYEPLSGAHIKGALTMGENIADLGGVLVALDAYHASLGGRPAPIIDGLTGDQRFFLGFAQVWREKEREDYERQLIVADVHSPSHYRVVGVVRNVDAWYDAFDVRATDPMYLPPDRRVRIW
jgi:putative endopeptidase